MRCEIVRRVVDGEDELGSIPPLLRRIYLARNVRTADDLAYNLSSLYPFDQLLNINKAVERLTEALEKQQTILVVGDFDVDGATSSALAVAALRVMGASHVSYLVPNRFTYGYGLTPKIVDVAKERNPDLIVTVDNGISSHAGVERAKELGIDVIITDHHLPGQTLPDAYTIVNPNQPGDSFPAKNLAGVGVIFYVMLALRAHLKEEGWFAQRAIPTPNMGKYLDLVALGTIADVVPFDKNNRILVQQGLKRIRAGKTCHGIAALLQVSGRRPAHLKAADLGFAVGPRLNAAGRLDDMSLGISCLLAEDKAQALQMAQELDGLNKERRVIEAKMQQDAFEAIGELALGQRQLPFGLCVYQPHWHQGVVGLVASRVKEKWHRPVIAFAKEEDGTLKGSARSVPGLHIRDVLESIAVQHPELISKFGGHAMAAGLSLSAEGYRKFADLFAKAVEARMDPAQLQGKYETDGELGNADLTLVTAEMLFDGGPWGQGFPEPVFDGVFKLVSQRIVGGKHLKMVIQLPDGEHYIDAIKFSADLDEWPNYSCSSVRMIYRLDINEFNGRRRLQLIVDYMQSV